MPILNNDNYIFNIPSVHVEGLMKNTYVTSFERFMFYYQEVGELLQATAKYESKASRASSEVQQQMRSCVIEKLTHVLVSLAVLAKDFKITQTEINNVIMKETLPGIEYPLYPNADVSPTVSSISECEKLIDELSKMISNLQDVYSQNIRLLHDRDEVSKDSKDENELDKDSKDEVNKDEVNKGKLSKDSKDKEMLSKGMSGRDFIKYVINQGKDFNEF